MARINLLPWRAKLRKERQRQFASVTGLSVLLVGLVMFVVHMHMAGRIDAQNERNEFLNKEIAELDKRIKEIKELEATKAKLLARMNIIEQLQHSRPNAVRMMDEMVRVVPDGVQLTSFEHRDTSIKLDGIAQSNARVSAYMRNLENSPWFADPRLDVIQTKEQERLRISEFKLQAKQTLPKDNQSKQAAAETAP